MNMIILLKLMKLMINLELMIKKLLLELLKFILFKYSYYCLRMFKFLKIYFFKKIYNIILQNIMSIFLFV